MKKRKKLSILLSTIFFLNITLASNYKVKAEEVEDVTIKSVIVDKHYVGANDSVNITVEAISDTSGLKPEGTLDYILASGEEKSVDLKLVDGKFQGKIDITDEDKEGIWKINFITLADANDNVFGFYNSAVHKDIGQDMSAANFVVDFVSPKVAKCDPENGVRNVALNKEMTLTFNELIAKGTAFDKIAVTDRDGNNLSIVKEINENILTIKADGGLKCNEKYTITVPNNAIADLAGNEIEAAYVAIFTTPLSEVEIDPILVKVAVDKTLVKVGSVVNVTLETSQPVNEASIVYVAGDDEKGVDLKLVDGKYVGQLTIDESFADGQWNMGFITLNDKDNNTTIVYNLDVYGDMGQDLNAGKIVVDNKAPVITVTGVKDGESYNTDVVIGVNTDDGKSVVKLNGNVYNNEKITAEGKYELVVTAEDEIGNASICKVNFTIDKTAPVLTVTGVEAGKLYNTNVVPKMVTNEGTITATLNGKDYKGEEITADGVYNLEVTATDLAGNKSTFKTNFAIDKTAPVITVTGVEEGKVYEASVTPAVAFNDKDAVKTITLDGKAYDGKAITAVGKHTLVVTAVDAAGNKSEVKVNFEVKAKAATPTKPTMPKTGSMIDMNVLFGAGLLLMLAGVAFVITSRKRNA